MDFQGMVMSRTIEKAIESFLESDICDQSKDKSCKTRVVRMHYEGVKALLAVSRQTAVLQIPRIDPMYVFQCDLEAIPKDLTEQLRQDLAIQCIEANMSLAYFNYHLKDVFQHNSFIKSHQPHEKINIV